MYGHHGQRTRIGQSEVPADPHIGDDAEPVLDLALEYRPGFGSDEFVVDTAGVSGCQDVAHFEVDLEFTDCLRVKEGDALKFFAREYKTYAPGIGLIQDEGLELTEYGFVEL